MDLTPYRTFMNSMESIVRGAIGHLPNIAASLVVLVLTWGAVTATRWVLSRVSGGGRMRRSLMEVIRMLASVGLWFGGTLIAITVAFPSVTPAKALTALGLGSVAIGFAFKDVFENFLAGLLILLREPFRLGDYVECDGVEGQVERITIRDTHILQTDGQLVVTPNAYMFKNPVRVRTVSDLRRATIICGVAYAEDADEARKVILDAVREADSVRNDIRDVQVFAREFASSSVDFEIAWWTGSRPVDIRTSRDEVVRSVKRALDRAGIEIPFPYRTLTFRDDSPMTLVPGKGDDEAQ